METRMLRILHYIAGIVVAASIFSATQVQSAPEVTLRFQHFVSPKGAVSANFIIPWAQKVEKESHGRIKIEIYPAMQLGGSPTALYDQIRDNVIDGGWALPSYTPGRFPAAEVFELPFMSSTSAEGTSKALWEFYEKYLTDVFKDIKVLAMHVHGYGVIHTKNKAVRSLADMKGLKLRTPSRVSSQFLQAAGAIPIGMPLPAFPEALSKGVVDGGIIPWEVVLPFKINELANNHTMMSGNRALYNTVFIWGMNLDRYKSLPKDLKEIIDNNSGKMVSAWAGKAMDTGDIAGKMKTQAGGNNLIQLTDDQTDAFKAIAAPVIEKWISTMTAKGLPAAEMIKDARAMVQQYD